MASGSWSAWLADQWLRYVARVTRTATSIVNTIRSLLAGQPVGTNIWVALAWCVGILVAAYLVATAISRSKTA